jgi:hypothetical protein
MWDNKIKIPFGGGDVNTLEGKDQQVYWKMMDHVEVAKIR